MGQETSATLSLEWRSARDRLRQIRSGQIEGCPCDLIEALRGDCRHLKIRTYPEAAVALAIGLTRSGIDIEPEPHQWLLQRAFRFMGVSKCF
jgi:hypothetical protein